MTDSAGWPTCGPDNGLKGSTPPGSVLIRILAMLLGIIVLCAIPKTVVHSALHFRNVSQTNVSPVRLVSFGVAVLHFTKNKKGELPGSENVQCRLADGGFRNLAGDYRLPRDNNVSARSYEVCDLHDPSKAHRVYAWSHDMDNSEHPKRHVTVLHIPPVISPETA